MRGRFPKKLPASSQLKVWGVPPDKRVEEQRPAIEQLRSYVDEMRDLSGRIPRRYPSLEDAFQRMQRANPHLNAEQARHLTEHGVNQNEDGTYSWKFDNYVRPNAPFTIRGRDTVQFWQSVRCPTLLFRGAESWATDPNSDGRLSFFEDARAVTIDGAGHWVHHDQFEEFTRITSEFLGVSV